MFDVRALLKKGGNIAYIANWTIDAGAGIDDFLIIVSENGDVLIYKGTDPSSAATFTLVGQWNIGEIPKGRRCFTQYGGDLLLFSRMGMFPVSYVTRGGAGLLQASDQEYTSKIQPLINEDLAQSSNLYGWEVLLHPGENLILVKVPNNNSVVNRQYAMNTINSSWCIFNDLPMNCMEMCSGFLLFGTTDGKVCMAFTQGFDKVPLTGVQVGNPVQGFMQSAFSYFDNPGAFKHFLMVRPTFTAAVQPSVISGINTDFATVSPGFVPTYLVAPGSRWDVDTWDAARWGGDKNTYQSWQGVVGMGYLGSLAMSTTTATDTQLSAIDFMLEVGGAL